MKTIVEVLRYRNLSSGYSRLVDRPVRIACCLTLDQLQETSGGGFVDSLPASYEQRLPAGFRRWRNGSGTYMAVREVEDTGPG